jgi:hypothetical protein
MTIPAASAGTVLMQPPPSRRFGRMADAFLPPIKKVLAVRNPDVIRGIRL